MSTPPLRRPNQAIQPTSDVEGSQVILEDGDPRLSRSEDAVDWDWDAEAVSAAAHCRLCGSLEPLFKLEDGSIVCRACCHGHAEQLPASRPGSGASSTPDKAHTKTP